MNLEDIALLEKPLIPISELILFSSTFAGVFSNLHFRFEQLGDKLVLEGSLIAINSNFTHRCQPGFEMYLKSVIKLNKKKEEFTKKRQGQGDGTCFNSSIEMIISLDDNPTPSDKKIYKVKLFPTTGNVQIPGVNEQDLSDGLAVLQKTAFILNKNKIGDELTKLNETETELTKLNETELNKTDDTFVNVVNHLQIEIKSYNPIMINYKFRINRSNERLLINLKYQMKARCINYTL